jgi:hypothetical protein
MPTAETRHDGVFSDVGATARAWLTGAAADGQVPGTPIPFLCAPST